jgi:hypothetical protein
MPGSGLAIIKVTKIRLCPILETFCEICGFPEIENKIKPRN